MRSRLTLFTFSLYLVLSLSGCTSKPSTDNATGTDAQNTTARSGQESKEGKEAKEAKVERREPLVVPAGTAVTVSLGSALGSK